MSTRAVELQSRARFLRRTIGTRSAAGFLRNRGVSLGEALHILVGRPL